MQKLWIFSIVFACCFHFRLIDGYSIFAQECFNKGVDTSIAIAIFNNVTVINKTYYGVYQCSSSSDCSTYIDGLTFEQVDQEYANDTLLVYDDPADYTNYSTQLSYIMKYVPQCMYNSVVLLTNRIEDIQKDKFTDYKYIVGFYCIDTTIMLLGRTQNGDLENYYSFIENVTLFSVPNYNCLANFLKCIPPCDSESYGTCSKYSTTTCGTITTTTTTFPPSTTTTGVVYYRSAVYVLALSNRLSQENLTLILNNLINPLNNSWQMAGPNHNFCIVVSTTKISPWFTDTEDFKTYLTNNITIDETGINANTYDTTDDEMVNRMNVTTAHANLTSGRDAPYVILLTDYFSTEFKTVYDNDVFQLKTYFLHVNVYNSDACGYYQKTDIKNACGTVDEEMPFDPSYPTRGPTTPTSTEITRPTSSLSMTSTTPPKVTGEKISEKAVIIIIFGAIAGAIAILCTGSFIYRQRMVWKTKLESIRASHHKHDFGDVAIDYWELTWDNLLVKSEKLGSGAFGQVLKGKAMGKLPCYEHIYENIPIRGPAMENIDVAIKMLPKYADEAAKKEFMNEINLMKLIGYHDNIVNMLGCITESHPMCLVLEFCPSRDLLQYVKARKVDVSISTSFEEKVNHTKEFLIFAWQIAQGMRFLASKGIIHRDLAARNVLIDAEKNAKISDFGLCVQTSNKSATNVMISASGRLPIKWLAIESLKNHEFSLKSDMYSFGATPFDKVEPKNLIDHLEAGNRPEKPELCSQEIYDIMLNCWCENPAQRPPFEELLTTFTVFLERTTEGYGYLPLLKCENALYPNEITQKLAQNLTSTSEPPKKSVRQRLTSESTKFLNLINPWSSREAVSPPNDEEATSESALKLEIPTGMSSGPPYSAGVEQIRPRFTSARSESRASLPSPDAVDPGVEIRNGRPRLRNNLSDFPNSSNSSIRKSSTFHHGDTSSAAESGSKRISFFPKFQ